MFISSAHLYITELKMNKRDNIKDIYLTGKLTSGKLLINKITLQTILEFKLLSTHP